MEPKLVSAFENSCKKWLLWFMKDDVSQRQSLWWHHKTCVQLYQLKILLFFWKRTKWASLRWRCWVVVAESCLLTHQLPVDSAFTSLFLLPLLSLFSHSTFYSVNPENHWWADTLKTVDIINVLPLLLSGKSIKCCVFQLSFSRPGKDSLLLRMWLTSIYI